MSEEPILPPEDLGDTSQAGNGQEPSLLTEGMSSQPSSKAVKPPLRPQQPPRRKERG